MCWEYKVTCHSIEQAWALSLFLYFLTDDTAPYLCSVACYRCSPLFVLNLFKFLQRSRMGSTFGRRRRRLVAGGQISLRSTKEKVGRQAQGGPKEDLSTILRRCLLAARAKWATGNGVGTNGSPGAWVKLPLHYLTYLTNFYKPYSTTMYIMYSQKSNSLLY